MKDKIEHNLGLTHEILLKLVFTINSSEQKTEYKKAGVLANCWKGNKVFYPLYFKGPRENKH